MQRMPREAEMGVGGSHGPKDLIGKIGKRTPADRLYGDAPTPNLFDLR